MPTKDFVGRRVSFRPSSNARPFCGPVFTYIGIARPHPVRARPQIKSFRGARTASMERTRRRRNALQFPSRAARLARRDHPLGVNGRDLRTLSEAGEAFIYTRAIRLS